MFCNIQPNIPYIVSYQYINDRIALLDANLPNKKPNKSKMRNIEIRFINAYGPTTEKAAKTPQLIKDFYSALQKVVDETPKSGTY